jgi:hypothetical protein
MRIRLPVLWVIFSIASACFSPLSAVAQSAQLNQLPAWRSEELSWSDNGGLPMDSEFSTPIVAQYNWAYGATMLGLTAHRVGGSDYYAVIALVVKHTLNAQDVIGPLGSPPQFSAGRYSLAVSTPDHVVYVWLTAPGADPRRVMLVTDAIPGAPIACLVQPPDPPSTKWEQWRATLAYAHSNSGTQLEVLLFDGAGRLLDSAPSISLPSALKAVALRPAENGWPRVLFAANDLGTSRGVAIAGVYLAAQSANGWAVARLVNAGGPGAAFPPSLPGGQDTAIVVSDTDTSGAFLQQIHLTDPTGGGLSQLGPYSYFSQPFTQRRYNLFESALSALPLLAFTDGTDILVAWSNPSRGHAPGLPGYAFLTLNRGDVVDPDQPAYPILALAGAAHWSTGNPELYWVQQGSPDSRIGQLFRIVFRPNIK